MNIKQHKIILFFALIATSIVFCQTIGNSLDEKTMIKIPKVIVFDRNDFKSNSQFWTMCENGDGTLIFGNNTGALIFDGEHWQKIRLPNGSPVNTLIRANNGTIYLGGFNELGVLQKNKYGNYFYKSLNSKFHIKEEYIENYWQVREFKKHIIFRAFSELIVVTGNRVTHLPSKNLFIYSEKVRDHYFVQDKDFEIFEFDSKTTSLLPVFDTKSILYEKITSILQTPIPTVFTLISKFGNVYTGDITTGKITKKLSLFNGAKKDIVSYGILGNNNDYLIGTSGSKIIRLTNTGEIIKEVPQFSDLSNAPIHSIFRTKNKNIWVLQSNGLSLLDYKSPSIKAFDQASVNDILVKNKMIYIATSDGVYFSDFKNMKENGSFNFKKVDNLLETAWAIQDLDNDIIISHDKGLYKLENGIALKIGYPNGFWKITKIKNKIGLYLGSTYNGLFLIEKKGGNWTIKNYISGFGESSRDILADYEPNTYWVCHGHKGVYKIHINSDYSSVDAVDFFSNKNGFISPFNINVFNWNNKIVFTTNTGIYTYNKNKDKFELFNPLNRILDPTKNTRKLTESKGKTWFVQDDEVGYFITGKAKLYKDLFLDLKGSFNQGMESIYPLDNSKVLFGTNNGLFLYAQSENKDEIVLPTEICQITYFTNQKPKLVEINSKENNVQLPNQTDVLRFEFSSPKMFSSTLINYSYKLENVDENWSPWQKNSIKEYTHLRPGNYTFYVKSMNLTGLVGKETSFKFTILPRWYQTILAYILYIIICAFLVYYLINYVKRKIAYERRKSKIEIKRSQQLLELEIEKLNLKKDKEEIYKDKMILEENIIDKSKELANYTLLLSQKKNIFFELQNDLKQLRELLKNEESKRKITNIFQKLNQHKIGEEYMEIFDVNFEKIHHDFFEKLKEIDPTITNRELRLCAFVKMDMTNKEISPLLNISARGVESARYRVRKKFNLRAEDNFVTFLENITINE